MNARKNKLKNHYNDKYKNHKVYFKLIDYLKSRWPRNRFEASVHWSPRGKRVLDIGCGNGTILYALRNHFDELHGIDISELRIKHIIQSFSDLEEKIFLKVADAEDTLPYPDNYFDYIICTAVIEHLIDVYGFLTEIHRVLVESGIIFIDTPNIAKWTRRIKLLFGIYPSTASMEEGLTRYDGKTPTTLLDDGHFHNFTYRLMCKLLKKSGFTVIEKYGCGPFGKLHKFWPELLSDDVIVLAKKA